MRYEIKNKAGNLTYRYISDDTHICDKCFHDVASHKCCNNYHFITVEKNEQTHSFCFSCKEVKNEKSAKTLANFIVYDYYFQKKKEKTIIPSDVDLNTYTDLLKVSFHNSKTIVSNMKNKIFSLLDSSIESFLLKNNKIDYIQQCIKENSRNTARQILSCLKSAEQVLHEFALVDFLHPQSIISDKMKGSHKAHTIYVLSFYMYETDFQNKYLKVKSGFSDSKIYIHFETAKTAIAQILDNTLKYARKNSIVNVTFEKKTIEGISYIAIVFNMESIAIRKSEISLFCQIGQRGIFAQKAEIDGNGLGLYITQKMLNLNDGFLEIDTNDTPKKHNGRSYTNNTFRLYFKEATD